MSGKRLKNAHICGRGVVSALAHFIHRITLVLFSEIVGNLATTKQQFPYGERGRANAPAALPLLPLRLVSDCCISPFPVLLTIMLLMCFLGCCVMSFNIHIRTMAPPAPDPLRGPVVSPASSGRRCAAASLRRTPPGFGPSGQGLMAKVNPSRLLRPSGRAASTTPAAPVL